MRGPSARASGGGDLAPLALRRAAAYAWRLLLVAAAVAVVVYALTRLAPVVVPVLLAVLVTAVLDSPAGWLRRRGLPRWAAAVLTLLAALALGVGIAALVVPTVVEQFGSLDFNIQRGLQRIERFLGSVLPVTQSQLRSAVGNAVDALQGQLQQLTSGFFGIAQIVADILLGAFIALFAVFFFLKDGRGMFAGFCRLFPEHRRHDIAESGRRSWQVLKRFLQGLMLVALADAVFIALALWLIGVPLVIPLAVITFFAAFFPFVGAIAAGGIAALVALVSGGLVDALLVVAAALVVQQIEGNLLQPLIVGHQVRLHPLAILLAVTAGGLLVGILGALLAVPVTAVLVTVIQYFRSDERSESGRADEETAAPEELGQVEHEDRTAVGVRPARS